MLQSLLVLVTDYFSHLKIRLLVEGRAGEGKRREGKGRGGDDVWDENGLCAFVVVFCVCLRMCTCDILLSSASARRTCRLGSRNRSAASLTGGAPRG